MPQFPSVIALGSLDGGDGFRLSGAASDDRAGFSVKTAGDVNGDGFADMIVGAFGADPNGSGSGASYVVFGKAAGFGTNLDLSTLTGGDGFRIAGENSGYVLGTSVSSAGDVNGDGFDDLLIGSSGADIGAANAGASYVVFGKASGFSASLNASTLDGNNGFRITGEASNDRSGFSVSSAGDVNGDGFADVFAGAYGSDANGADSGAAYVIFGKASGFAASLSVSALDGANGFQLTGELNGDFSGISISDAGDVNGDGFADIIAGAFGNDDGGSFGGKAHVVFGKASGFAADIALASLDGTNGFALAGETGGDYLGSAVAAAGDVNGDGFADIVVGAPNADTGGTDTGSSYLIFGKASGFDPDIDLSALDGNDGIEITGATVSGKSGSSLGGAGDVNGDGLDDIIIGAPSTGNGASYVLFGSASGFGGASISVSSLDGTTGFRIDGAASGDRAGEGVSSAGDIDFDGFDDLIVGASAAGPNGTGSGAAYVIYGRKPTEAAIVTGTVAGQTLAGGDLGDILSGAGGNDALWGHGGIDQLDGGTGADAMRGGSGNDLYAADNVNDTAIENAGEGTDTVSSSVSFTLGANVENLTLTGSVATSATGNGIDNVIAGNGIANILTGDAGNDTLDGGGGADSLAGGSGNDSYAVDNAGDTVTEAAGGGTDAVQSSVAFTLGANVENLTLAGISAVNGTGNGGANAITGNSAANVLDGGSGNDTLNGAGGNDTLNGGAGNDAMAGGTGDDTYTVSAAGDGVSEAAASGIDTVQASIAYTLGANVEKLKLTSASAINGTGNGGGNFIDGNTAANTLTGLGGADRLDGKGGADTMIGGLGDEIYYIDNAGDVVTELAGQGTDLVRSTLAIDLSVVVNIENASVTSSADVAIVGSSAANVLTGGNGDNAISGGGGNDTIRGNFGADTMSGGADADTFVWLGLNESVGANRDTISGFVTGTDKLDFVTIDANATAGGNQNFVLDTNASFSAGEFRTTAVGADLLLEGNTDNDANAEIAVLFVAIATLAAEDFV